VIAQVFAGGVAFDAVGLWLGAGAAVLVGVFAGWREWSRTAARQVREAMQTAVLPHKNH